MTDYKTIRGKKIKSFATDLGNEQAEGQIFYSNTDNQFKTAVSSAAWHSEAPIISGRTVAQGATGTATAGLICFGNPYSAPYTLNETEEYNGSSWAIGGDTTHAASNATAAGTQTAAIAIGISNSPTTLTIKYDGTSWTDSGHAFPSTGGGGVGSGTQTATLYSGQGGGTNSYEYDGSSWTSGGTMATSRVGEGTGWGPQTSALMCTGRASPSALTSATEEYNGTSWTSTNNVNAARRRISGSQNSTSQDSGIIFGGSPTSSPNANATVNTEQYDGSSWTEITNLSTGRNHAGGAGNSTSAWVAGSNPNSALTEEFNITVNTITAGAWSSGGNLPSNRGDNNTNGIQTAVVSVAGYTTDRINTVDEYDGSSWTNSSNYPVAVNRHAGAGTQTAQVTFGGRTGSGSDNGVTTTAEYDGSNWTSGGALPAGKQGHGGFGTQTAAVAAGGRNDSTYFNTVEEYNGTSWTASNNIPGSPGAMGYTAGLGTAQTAGLIYGGNPGPSPGAQHEAFEYDGTNFSATNDMGTARYYGTTGGGTQTAGIIAGGRTGAPAASTSSNVEAYDGTSFSTFPSLAVATRETSHGGSTGTQTAGFVCGGRNASDNMINNTQEFTPESTSLNLKTITDS